MNILVVENEPFIRLDLSDRLEAAGYSVTTAANADEAIRILEKDREIRVVMSDVNMPGT